MYLSACLVNDIIFISMYVVVHTMCLLIYFSLRDRSNLAFRMTTTYTLDIKSSTNHPIPLKERKGLVQRKAGEFPFVSKELAIAVKPSFHVVTQ